MDLREFLNVYLETIDTNVHHLLVSLLDLALQSSIVNGAVLHQQLSMHVAHSNRSGDVGSLGRQSGGK